MNRATILGTGSCLPRRVLTNDDLEQMVDTSDEWITTRTGIKSRRIAGRGEETFRLATGAAEKALAMAGITAKEIDLIVTATMTPHMLMPSCACYIQAELGAHQAFAFDINAACSGFVYGLDLVDKYIRSSPQMKVLLIGAENLSSRVDWKDRNTCILFGDGAGACVIGTGDEKSGFVDSELAADGRLAKLLYMHGPTSLNPELDQQDGTDCALQMSGRDVFKHAVRAMTDAVNTLLNRQQLTIDDVSLLIPHQANIRILKKLARQLNIPEEKVYINVEKYGNTSAASVPIALDEANRQGKLNRGDLLLTCSFGGGFTWGALLLKW